MEKETSAHVLILTYPVQGHINPMLQFSKCLVSKGLKVTLAITAFIAKSLQSELPQSGSIKVETFSDGFDENGFADAGDFESYINRFQIVGSQTLSDLIVRYQQSCGELSPFSCLVYDSFLPWALDVAKKFKLVGAPFFTQACAVNIIYYHVHQGLLSIPVTTGSMVCLPGLPPLEISDLPSFISICGSYLSLFNLVFLNQFCNLDRADYILVNSFDKLEHEAVSWMSKLWPVRAIGPTVPSAYSNNLVEDAKDYGLNLFKPSNDTCIDWLNTKDTRSVVYVSFGSLAELTEQQMEELAWALRGCNYYFLWVVRASEMIKLPSSFCQETSEQGLVVNWCPQLEVLSHSALGCFITHCGWNSTLEALSFGVPMVVLPQWTDQATNAKLVKDVFKTGMRAIADENGISARTELEKCIREVMEGESGKEIIRNAHTWKELAKEAVNQCGSSDNNIVEFVSHICGKSV